MGKHKVAIANDMYRCPFCPGKKKQEYHLKDLLQHSVGVGSSNRTVVAFHSTAAIDYGESTISDIQSYFVDGSLTSRHLVSFYITRIQSLNPYLHAIIEVNPDALSNADIADLQRLFGSLLSCGILHDIPILLKDNIATRDRLNTTAVS
ncbi:hypothetical protein KSP40_PGU019134 [Platanthera guangdongensis]|uniref:Uncharacterized protein n=1 Tax=Platanthera guangdongensis TaxID=2320717 RepID=A0ABR2LZZ2_9ASPA